MPIAPRPTYDHHELDTTSSESDGSSSPELENESDNEIEAIEELNVEGPDNAENEQLEGINWKDIPSADERPFWLNERPKQVNFTPEDMELVTNAYESTSIDYINVASGFGENPFDSLELLITDTPSILPYVFYPSKFY